MHWLDLSENLSSSLIMLSLKSVGDISFIVYHVRISQSTLELFTSVKFSSCPILLDELFSLPYC